MSVLVAVHNGERFLRPALESISTQTFADFELVVVDDGSSDSTPSVLAAYGDPRLRVVWNAERRGLAGALNRGLDEVRGRYVARMDADDIAFPFWLEHVLGRLLAGPEVALVGAGVMELSDGRLGAAHVPQPGRAVTRWHSLFSASPFFHNTVVFDNELLRVRSLRYDESFAESEDYELWTRVLEHAEADALEELLVLYRLHSEQASQRRAQLQLELGRRVAFGQIAGVAPELSETEVDLAWRFGCHRELDGGELERAADAYLELVARFLDSGRYSRPELAGVRAAAARVLARRARAASGTASGRLLRDALRLDPSLVVHAARRRARRARQARYARDVAAALLRGPDRSPSPIRVAAVFPEPTPYRTPLLDRIAALDEIDLTVVYAAGSVVAGRSWEIERRHDATVLRGLRVPGGGRVFRHDYPVTPGIARALRQARPDVVVVSGWSTFAAQAAIAWCRARNVPYVLVVESHDDGPRPGWRRKVKGAVVPSVVGSAAGVLVTGTRARSSMIARGASPERIRVFANTVDVEAFGERVDQLGGRRLELRAGLGVDADDVVVLSVARLGPEKRLDDLLRAVAAAGESRLVVVVAGEGQERSKLGRLAAELGIRLVLTGDVEWERIVELYAAADVFALLSERETWGVVVNEAAACGLPLVLSDRVGAAHDLLRDGENGMLVPAGDVGAAAEALRALETDRQRRLAMGARSRELARDWGYGPSVEGFVAAVREAVADRR